MALFPTSRPKMQLRVAPRALQMPTDFGRSSSDSAGDIRDQSFSLYAAPSGEHRFFSDDFLPRRSPWPARSDDRITGKSIMTFSRNRRSQFFENVQYVQKNVYMKRLDDDRWDCRNQLSAESPTCCIELLNTLRGRSSRSSAARKRPSCFSYSYIGPRTNCLVLCYLDYIS